MTDSDPLPQAIKPLAGIRILDLTRLLPGPFATHYLCQLGATVIKVEDKRSGDYVRQLNPDMFALLNRDKESLVLDLRGGGDRERFLEAVGTCDAVLESFRPGVMDSLGLGFDTLSRRNPALVYGALTGYGQSGPYSDVAGHDINYIGYAGLLDQSGTADKAPALCNLQIADQASGGLTFALGVVSAILRAKLTGRGAFVDVGMSDATLAMMINATASLNATGKDTPRGEGVLSGGLPNYAVYECADGGYFALGALEPKFWNAFCEAVARPDLLNLPLAPGRAGDELRAELKKLFISRPRNHWTDKLAHLDLCASPVLSVEEALNDAHNVARGVVRREDGKYVLNCPIHVTDDGDASCGGS